MIKILIKVETKQSFRNQLTVTHLISSEDIKLFRRKHTHLRKLKQREICVIKYLKLPTSLQTMNLIKVLKALQARRKN